MTLRIVELTEKAYAKGREYMATLSNRSLARGNRTTKRNDDLERFNRGYDGFIDRDQTTSGWNPAGDGIAQTLEIPNWPDDVVREDLVELTVQGRAWRSPVYGGGHSHGVSVTHPSHSHDVDVYHPSHDHSISVTHPSHDHSVDVDHPSHDHSISTTESSEDNTEANAAVVQSSFGASVQADGTWTTISSLHEYTHTSWLLLVVTIRNLESSQIDPYARLHNDDTGYYDPEFDGKGMVLNAGETGTWVFFDPSDIYGDRMEFDVTETSGNNMEIGYKWLGAGRHSHDTNISTTSSAALGTTSTETSTTELGTTESTTSSTELGTTSTDTSTSELGTTEFTSTSNATDLEAGVIDTFGGSSYYPTDVEIRVNGTLITTIAGDNTAEWQESVDIRGELLAGGNTITATPTGQRGSLNLHLSSELFRRGKTS